MANADLQWLFLTGLTLAGIGCGSSTPKPVPTKAEPVATSTSAPAPSASVAAEAPPAKTASAASVYASEFHSVGAFANAFPGVEHVALVSTNGMIEPFTCDPAPCTKQWTKLGHEAGGTGAVVRRNGVLQYVLIAKFKETIGVVDTPEKAAARLRYYFADPLGTCANFKELAVACAKGSSEEGVAVRAIEGGFDVATYGTRNVCPGPSYGGAVAVGVMRVAKDGEVTRASNALTVLADEQAHKGPKGPVECQYPSLGRMFAGFIDLPRAESELEYLLKAQRQEAAAVIAFERLAIELAAHGAPSALIDAARRSADEEREHTALFRAEATALFEALGMPVEIPEPNAPADFAIRPLLEILRENILEGCANETYAAIVATHQSESAKTARLRAIFATIAADEQGHAALAHRIFHWGLGVVDREAADALREERLAAIRDMHAHIAVTDLGRAMGEPEPARAMVAFDHVSDALLATSG